LTLSKGSPLPFDANESEPSDSPLLGFILFFGVHMAKKIQKRKTRKQKKSLGSPFHIYWVKENYIFLVIGLAFILAGFYFLGQGPWNSSASLVTAPILLFIGYVVIFPLSILFRKKKEQKHSRENEVAAGKS
jgi:membrane protein YdbS with pleckstrin-like domain